MAVGHTQLCYRWWSDNSWKPYVPDVGLVIDDTSDPRRPEAAYEIVMEEVRKPEFAAIFESNITAEPLGLPTSDVRDEIAKGKYRPRLRVKKALHQMYASLVDDVTRHILAASNTLCPELRSKLPKWRDNRTSWPRVNGRTVSAAFDAGILIGRRARRKGITKVRFDRGKWKYHGRVRAVAEGARKAGLQF